MGSFAAFVGKHLCIESDVGSSMKPVEEVRQWSGVEKPRKVEDEWCCCILNKFEQRQTY